MTSGVGLVNFVPRKMFALPSPEQSKASLPVMMMMIVYTTG
jgi:hypothetical protein